MRKPFKFKKFSLVDANSAMKLSTDAVLLGAFAPVDKVKSLLDIGTGSGIVALIMAQRSNAEITAIDLDKASISDARTNFINSPWSERLHAIHISIQDYLQQGDASFDLIVCNPPFFTNNLHSPIKARTLSKHNDLLSFSDLLAACAKLLRPGGRCCFILPVSEKKLFISQGSKEGLFLTKNIDIYPKPNKKPNRILLELAFNPRGEQPLYSTLTIRGEDDRFTPEYKKFTKAFYLDF